ncbi:unnamed protein product [Diamesa serratosioi]
MNRHNSFITSSISNELESPQKIFVEKSHNSIDLNPVHVQKKSMYLIDLTTPFVKNSRHSNRSHVTSTPKISENNSISTRKDNNLLKSAIKNSNVKKRRAGRSIKLPSSIAKSVVKTISSTHAESPLFLSCCDTSPVIEVNETLDDTFESFSPSIKEECKIVISSQNSNDTEKSPEVRNQKYDSKDVSGIIELMKSPKYHTSKILDEPTSSNTFIKSEQMDSDEDGIRELLTSISSVLEDSKDISIETLDLCKELPPISINISEEPPTDNTECLESEKLVYVIEPEFKTMDRSFDELIGIPTITKTYNRKSSLFVQDKADEESTIEMKLKEKECGERVIKWIEDVKASGSLEISNKTKQIISSRYSNVTPNDSLVDSTSLNKTSYAADQTIIGNYSPRLSILETMEHLKQDKFEDSQINQKLTISPVSRLSIIVNSTEVLENYHLQKNHEIPNSLRSTRKKFGMAFASLHNVSAQATEDLNESINNSIHSYNDGMKEDEESKSSSPNILSLDDYQRKTDDEMCHKTNRQSLLYNSYIEFVKTDDCDERSEDDDVFEISDSIQSSDASIESDQSSEHECDNESSSEILFIDESERRLIDKTSDDLFDDIKPIKSSSEDDDEPNELKDVAETVIAKRGVNHTPQFSSTEKLTKNISATNESLNVLVVENDQISTMDDIIIDTSENGVQKKKELFVIEVPEDFPELKIPKIEETLNLSFSVIANSTAKESVEQDKLLHSATDAVAIKRTRGIKVNYLEMVTRSTLKSSTPQKSAKNYEEESRKTQIKTPLNRKLLKISTQIDEIRERELELSIETINNDKESSKVEVLKVAVPKITRGRKKTVKNVENELAFEKNVAEQETVTTDKLRTGTPKKRRLKTVKDVEAIPVVTKKIDLAEAELDQEEEFRMDVKISGHNKLNTEVPRRGRKKTVKGVETKPVVSKKKDLVKTELEHGEVEESQMADDIAETPRRGRKKMVKDVETKPVVLKKVDLDDIEQEKATEIRVTKKRKAELVKYAEMVTTDIIPKRRLRGAKNKDDGEPDTVKETTTKIASNKVDLAEVEIKELIVEESQMKKKVAKQKAVTINNSTAETPKRGRKKTVKDVETKPVVSKKKDLVETELEHGEVEESQMAEDIAETPRRGRKKMVKDVETKPVVLKKVDLDDIEQEKATEIRVTKKRKAEPVKYAEMVTTDIIPKRRLRGAKNKEDGEPDTVKETTTKIESAEPNSLKRKIIPTTTETEVVTVVKKSRVKSIKVIEEPFANEKIVLQNILGKNTDPKSSEVAQKVVLSTEVKRSTRRKN